MSEKPEQKFRVGAVSTAVWKRVQKTKNGTVFESKSVSLDRRYQDQEGNWKSSSSLDINDIPKAILALQKAYEYIAMQSTDDDDVRVSDDYVR